MRFVFCALVLLLSSISFANGKLWLLVDKGRYRLYVMHERLVVRSYPCVFGGDPVHDKLREGDSCTPEGEFRIAEKHPQRFWSRFMLLSYPTATSRGMFTRAKRDGLLPPNATIGGAVGIHCVPVGYDSAIDRRHNWTLGCISVKRTAIKELYAMCPVGTRVRIVH